MVHEKWVLVIFISDYKKKISSSKCNANEVQLPDVFRTKQYKLCVKTFLDDCTTVQTIY